jgi:DNA-binding response OmpR family regulator
MVKQVLLNLAGNAVKFTPTGGEIQIIAEPASEEGRDRLQSSRRGIGPGEIVEFAVVDTGIGISAKDQELIFGEFRQADGSYTREHQGSGLGLTLSKRFVELNRGSIWVTSDPGEGSQFRFVLPAEPATEPVPESGEEREVSSERILLVEDDLNSLKLLRRHLERAGYEVLSATNGEKALNLAMRYRPQVIALDIMLPDMDGWTIMKRLRARPETERIPVVITSVLDNPDLGIGLGAVDYFTKPVDRKRFLARIAELGEWRRSEIVVVESDPERRGRIAAELDRPGWRVHLAGTAAEAREWMSQEAVDVMLLDLDLPERTAYGLMDELRHLEHSLALILTTGAAVSAEDRRRFCPQVETLLIKDDDLDRSVAREIARIDRVRNRAVGSRR